MTNAEVIRFRPLPPQQFRIYDPLTRRGDERFPTALDSRGLVDMDTVIQDVKATIDSSYEWQPKSKNHHFQWPDDDYPNEYTTDQLDKLSVFRNIPSRRGMLPIDFECWLHQVTIPPPIPSSEVRRYSIEAWNVAHNLFTMANETVVWERRRLGRRAIDPDNPLIKTPKDDIIAEEYMREVFDKNFQGLDLHIKQNEQLPREFRLVDHEAPTIDIVRGLRSIVANRAINLVPMVKAA